MSKHFGTILGVDKTGEKTLAHGEHKEGDRLVGAYKGIEERALLIMIKEATGRTMSDMVGDMIIREAEEAGFADENGIIKEEFKSKLAGVMAMVRFKDIQRKGSRTKER